MTVASPRFCQEELCFFGRCYSFLLVACWLVSNQVLRQPSAAFEPKPVLGVLGAAPFCFPV